MSIPVIRIVDVFPAKQPSYVNRLWSATWLGLGWIQAVGGGFTEDDDVYRERIKREFGRTL